MKPGNKYRPSNGTEGMIFIENHCDHCIHEFPHPDKNPKCEIMSASFLYDINHEKYPKEWVYDEKGHPTCTNYRKWDWGQDDGFDNGWNIPPPDIDPDPNQLCLPFEIEFIEQNIQIEKEVNELQIH